MTEKVDLKKAFYEPFEISPSEINFWFISWLEGGPNVTLICSLEILIRIDILHPLAVQSW